MRLQNPIVAKRAFLDIRASLPDVEARANALDDPAERNVKVAQLARFDQQMALLRDALAESGCPVDAL